MYAFRNIDFSFLKTYGVGLFRVESKELDASESVPVSEVFIDLYSNIRSCFVKNCRDGQYARYLVGLYIFNGAV